MNEFVDYYEVLGAGASGVGPESSAEELQKRYKSLLLNWHPDKRPQSASGEGKRQTCLINAAWDTLKSPRRRDAYNFEWKRVRDERMLPFERAEDRRRKGNDLYRDAHVLCRDGHAFEAAKKYMLAIEMYTDGITQGTGDHRLHSNRALCYAALQEWAKAKKDALETTKLRPHFMKGWFTLCRSYLMDSEAHVAAREIEKALNLCDRHPDLIKLQEEIRLAMGDRDQRAPKNHPTYNVSPACTPPTPRRPVNPLVRNGPQWGMDLEQTANFGRTRVQDGDLNETANFGLRTGGTTPHRFMVNPPTKPGMSAYSNLGGTYTPPRAGPAAVSRTPPTMGTPLSPVDGNPASGSRTPPTPGPSFNPYAPVGQRTPPLLPQKTPPRSFGPSLAQMAKASALKEKKPEQVN